MRFFEKVIDLFTGRRGVPQGSEPVGIASTQPAVVRLPVPFAAKPAPAVEPGTPLAKASKREGSSVIAATVESQASVSRPLHWLPTELFPIHAVGASSYTSEIASLARNPAGTNALVFCTATLVPESTNIYDPNAVMVQIEGQKVAYLPREYAKRFRTYFDVVGLPLQPTTCDATISNGLRTEDKHYSYSIELDIAPEPPRLTAMLPTYTAVVRRDTAPEFAKQEDGRYLVAVRLGPGVLEDMRDSVESWTTEHWTVINYYLPNRQGIGLGHKLFEIPKAKYAAMFGEFEPDASIESLVGRDAVIALKPAVLV